MRGNRRVAGRGEESSRVPASLPSSSGPRREATGKGRIHSACPQSSGHYFSIGLTLPAFLGAALCPLHPLEKEKEKEIYIYIGEGDGYPKLNESNGQIFTVIPLLKLK